jgi:hypothetical protein
MPLSWLANQNATQAAMNMNIANSMSARQNGDSRDCPFAILTMSLLILCRLACVWYAMPHIFVRTVLNEKSIDRARARHRLSLAAGRLRVLEVFL